MARTNKIVVPEIITTSGIQTRIFEIRGERVMLDRDLAELYGVPTKVLNQAVKRNIERFPINFMFQLENQELANLRSQFVTACGTYQTATLSFGKRNKTALPYAFTEQGVAMLSAVLKSPTAIQVSIAIMEAFVQIRKMITDNRVQALEISEVKARLQLLEERMEENLGAVNDLSEDMRKEIDTIYQAIGELSVQLQPSKTKPNPVGYEAIEERDKKN